MEDNPVIGEGGFGCVFRKPLRCKTKKKIPAGHVSKLMSRKHGLVEYDISKRIYNSIVGIPNHTDYFILHDITKCDPLQIPTASKNIKKCKHLMKNDDIDTFNRRILNGEMLQLNIPYGGISLTNLWDRIIFSRLQRDKDLYRAFYDAIDGVVSLLENAVVPMNMIGIYHNDIKSDNVLYNYIESSDKYEYRIIDWGLSTISKDPSKMIDTGNRPFQWNSPLISPFMLDGLYRNINMMSMSCKGKNSSEISTLLEEHMKNISGHLEYIETSIIPIFSQDVSRSGTKIGDILSRNIDKYIKHYGVNSDGKYEFVKNVLSHNTDVIGMISIFIDLLITNYNDGSKSRKHPIFKYLKKFLWKYMYSCQYITIPIPISKLVHDIKYMKTI